MAGLRVAVGSGYGVDASGVMWLSSQSSAEDWARWIDAHVWQANERRAMAARLKAQEVSVAGSLGVGMIFAPKVPDANLLRSLSLGSDPSVSSVSPRCPHHLPPPSSPLPTRTGLAPLCLRSPSLPCVRSELPPGPPHIAPRVP